MKTISVNVDLREIIGMTIVDENEGKAYTILDAKWDDMASSPVLELQERKDAQ